MTQGACANGQSGWKSTEGKNCWEFSQCGREVGGSRVAELGVCPAAVKLDYDGLNGGQNGGRICWAVAGTFCGGVVRGSFAEKRLSCLSCHFFQLVEKEEGDRYKLLPPQMEQEFRSRFNTP